MGKKLNFRFTETDSNNSCIFCKRFILDKKALSLRLQLQFNMAACHMIVIHSNDAHTCPIISHFSAESIRSPRSCLQNTRKWRKGHFTLDMCSVVFRLMGIAFSSSFFFFCEMFSRSNTQGRSSFPKLHKQPVMQQLTDKQQEAARNWCLINNSFSCCEISRPS